PEMEGPEVAASLSDLEFPTIILALSSYDLPEFVENMIQNGARGYLTKDLAPRWLSVAALDLLEDRKKIWVPEKLRKDLELDLG
ncbi:MAG: hypothetical protein P8Y34_09540, partial [Anaerolineales bacterium]